MEPDDLVIIESSESEEEESESEEFDSSQAYTDQSNCCSDPDDSFIVSDSHVDSDSSADSSSDSSDSEAESDAEVESESHPGSNIKSNACDETLTFSWKADEPYNIYKPYRDDVQIVLRNAYKRYTDNRRNSEVELKGILRNVDDIFQDYKINFSQMVQINTKTKFERPIQITVKVEWSFLNDQYRWESFDEILGMLIEKTYLTFINYPYLNSIKYQIPSQPRFFYELNFTEFKQKNSSSDLKSFVKRTSK